MSDNRSDKYAPQRDVSGRVELLRFPLIVAVVFIHSDMTLATRGSHNPLLEFIDNLVSSGVARVAVPLFLAIAGYLFFVRFRWSLDGYASKLKRRFGTLLVPYLSWNLATLAAFAVGETLPLTRMYFPNHNWPPVASFGLRDYLNAIVGLGSVEPIAGPLWFIRDLMSLVLAAPLINFLWTKRLGPLLLGAVFIAWFTDVWPLIWPNAAAVFFFCLGAYLALARIDVCKLDRYGGAFLGAFLCAAILQASIMVGRTGAGFRPQVPLIPCLQGDGIGNDGWVVSRELHQIMILCGVIGVWWFAQFALDRFPRFASRTQHLGGASFFVFASHALLLRMVDKVVVKMLHPSSTLSILAYYLALPSLLITLLVLVHRLLVRYFPPLDRILSGARAPRVFQKAAPTSRGAVVMQ